MHRTRAPEEKVVVVVVCKLKRAFHHLRARTEQLDCRESFTEGERHVDVLGCCSAIFFCFPLEPCGLSRGGGG